MAVWKTGHGGTCVNNTEKVFDRMVNSSVYV